MQRLLLLCASLLCAGSAGAADKQPNILVILTDDQGYGDLGCYGAKDLLTPNLDRFVAEGMRFDQFRANSSVCSPTRAALLTGKFPDRVGVPGVIRSDPKNSWGTLAPSAVLLPRVLKGAGYHSAIIGKWHLGLAAPNTPNARGFDFFHGFLGDMMDDYTTHQRQGANLMYEDAKLIDPVGHATDLFSSWACEFLRRRAKQAGPFFLYLAFNAPHDPIQPPAEWLARVHARDPSLPEKRAKLVALIEHLDDGIGKVLETLKQTGLEENTLVIFTSDNGGALQFGAANGATRDGKGSMFEGGLRVPFAARWPGKIAAGSRSAVAAASMDIFATSLDAAGVTPAADLDALSLLPILTGKTAELAARDLYFVRREGAGFKGQTSQALIRGPWKILQNSPTGPLELYNLEADKLEAAAANQSAAPRLEELSGALQRQMQRAVPWQ
jgi:arylsulfatase A-like enzyme